jgi:hypothetical protein
MGLAPKMSPNRPRGQILRRFPEPSAKRPPWPKIKGAFWARHLGSRAGIPALICLPRAVLAAPQHGTHCPQAPWPEEQSWLKRKTFSALPRKSCRLNRVVTLLKWQADECSKAAVRVFFFTVRATLRVARTVGSGCAAGESTGAHGGRNLGLMALQGCGGLST